MSGPAITTVDRKAEALEAIADSQHTANLVAYLTISEGRGARDAKHFELELVVRERLGLGE